MTWKKVSRKFHDDFTKKITNLPSVKKIIIGWTSVLAPTGPPFLILDRPDINPACILVPPINQSVLNVIKKCKKMPKKIIFLKIFGALCLKL